MNSFLQDVRFAARILLKTPGFTVVAILTLALGIGANIAAFSIVDGVLLRPLPFPQPGQLVRVFDDLRSTNAKDVGMSVPQYWDYRDRAGIFQAISVIWPITANLTRFAARSASKLWPPAPTISLCSVCRRRLAGCSRRRTMSLDSSMRPC